VARPATPDFAAWRVEASPRYEEETGAQRSPRGEGTRAPPPEQSGLSQLRAALANKLSGIDFRGEAEKERVKMVKTFTDGIHLVYDLLEEERETQLLQMERKKQQLVQQQIVVEAGGAGQPSSPLAQNRLLKMELEIGDVSPPSPTERGKSARKHG